MVPPGDYELVYQLDSEEDLELKVYKSITVQTQCDEYLPA